MRKSDTVKLLDCNGFLVRHISEAQGWEMCGKDRAGKTLPGAESLATPTTDTRYGRTLLTKVQLRDPRPNYRTKPLITNGELKANAGEMGESRTLGRGEHSKRLRVERIRKEKSHIAAHEDFVERAKGKVAFMPLEHDRRNRATVGPKLDMAALEPFMEILEAVR